LDRLTVQEGDLEESRRVSPPSYASVVRAHSTYGEVLPSEGRVAAEVEQGEEKRWRVRSREEMDMGGRGRNLVILGVEEQGEEEERSGILGKIGQILEQLGQGERCQFKYIGRIGKKQGDSSRPVRIEMENMNLRRVVLSRAKNLKGSSSFGRVFIVPDRTKSQQMVDRKLRDKVRELRKGDVKDARIERGVIVWGSGVDKKFFDMQD
jgi:hypothetical protein